MSRSKTQRARSWAAIAIPTVAAVLIAGCGTATPVAPLSTSGPVVQSIQQMAKSYLEGSGESIFDTAPATAQTAGGVGLAVYRQGSRTAICVVSPFFSGCGPRLRVRYPPGDSLRVVASGIGLSDEIWAVVRLAPGTTRLLVAISHGRAHTRMFGDGYAIVTFTNRPVGAKRLWPEYSRGFDLGTVTGFNQRDGLVTGSDQIRVCYVGKNGPCEP